MRRNNTINCNPIIKKSEALPEVIDKEKESLKEIREKILAVLKLILNGDEVSSEYFLLNLISKVHTRKDGFILGNISLNLTKISPV